MLKLNSKSTHGFAKPLLRRALIACLALVIGLGWTVPAGFAYAADRETPSFNVSVKVNENNSYDITEDVTMVFNTPGHGIYRYIPEYFNRISEDVGGGWCDGRNAEYSHEDGNYIIKIGDADYTISGSQNFRYGYNITMTDDRDTSSDYFYLNVLPTNWETSIDKTHIEIVMPKSIKGCDTHVYTGALSSTAEAGPSISEGGNNSGVDWDYNDSTKTITIDSVGLYKGKGITVLVGLPEGYWVGQKSTEGYAKALGILSAIITLLAALGWFLFGRNEKPVETVEFYPPKGMTPSEVGLIADGNVDKRDIVALFIYFAHKGYLKISEIQGKDGKVKKNNFRFTKLKDIDSSEPTHAAIVFNGIFEESEGEETTLRKMGSGFATAYQAAKASLEDSYGSNTTIQSKLTRVFIFIMLIVLAIIGPLFADIYCVNGDDGGGALFCASVFCVIFAYLLLRNKRKRAEGKGKVGLVIILIFDALMLLLCGGFMYDHTELMILAVLFPVALAACQFFLLITNKTAKKYMEHMGQILGLKTFIKTAELDKLNTLVEDDPEYFYNVLPYAYVLGLSDKWIKKFENIQISTPDWYVSRNADSVLVPAYLFNMDSFAHAVSTNLPISIPSGSDSGGFLGGGGFSGGGGGFSGGGAGGGGGGSW